MPAAALINVSVAGGLVDLNLSGTAGINTYTRIENNIPALLGARVQGHGISPHAVPIRMAQASPNVFVNNVRLCRVTDAASCGHPISNGASTVFVN